MDGIRAIRVYLHVESSEPITEYTGRLTKTLIYAATKEIRLFRGLRGIISPIHVSPLFKPGRREYELGEVFTPVYRKNGDEFVLSPVEVNGEYVIHVGGVSGLVSKLTESLSRLRGTLVLKFGDSLISYKVLGIEDVTNQIMSKKLKGDRVTLYLKAPAKIFNVLAASRLPKFTTNAYELLMTGYMFSRGNLTLLTRDVLSAMNILGKLVETYYSLSTVRYILVPFRGNREPAMIGKITYILDTRDSKEKETIEKVLNTAEITGIGESRINGFGTVIWKSK